MKKHTLLLAILLCTPPGVYALYEYNNTPASTANPPETMEEDPNIPITPNIYGPTTPLSKQTPPGTVVSPNSKMNDIPNYKTTP